MITTPRSYTTAWDTTADITFGTNFEVKIVENEILTAIFSNYLPGDLGLIDYNGPQRFFQREGLGGIQLNVLDTRQQSSHRALYNYAQKYANIKTELASAYLRQLVQEKSGRAWPESDNLDHIFSDMFTTFFPDKRYLGAQPTESGLLEFPIETETGINHDINDLRSGEKEIAYGYLRLRESAPRYSIILLDEPELHLNPALARALPGFYKDHLGATLDNQIWLVTHSDAIIRQVVGLPNYDVYHMAGSKSVPEGSNQLQRINGNEELASAVLSLVGDLATFSPAGKLVLFEGSGEADFDVFMVKSLLGDFLDGMNCVSAESKIKVRALADILEESTKKGKLPFAVFSVTDMDAEQTVSSGKHFSWDSYHIENYLLEPYFILYVLLENPKNKIMSVAHVERELLVSAKGMIGKQVRHAMITNLERRSRSTLPTGIPKASTAFALDIEAAVAAMATRVAVLQGGELSRKSLEAEELTLRAEFLAALTSGLWRRRFQGREILKDFAGRHLPGAGYEVFRNSIVARMREAGFKPIGMAKVLRGIASA